MSFVCWVCKQKVSWWKAVAKDVGKVCLSCNEQYEIAESILRKKERDAYNNSCEILAKNIKKELKKQERGE